MNQIEPRTDVDRAPMPAPPPRRHTALRIVGIASAIVVALITIGAVTQGPHVARPAGTDGEVLLVEEFDSGTTEFSTDSDRWVDLSVVDGVYRVTIKDSPYPQLMRHLFVRSYDGIRFEATIAYEPDVGEDTVASVGCWTADSGYVFGMMPDGRVGLLETVSERTGDRVELTKLVEADAARPPGEANRLRIDCVGGGKGSTIVSGYVNGEPVLSVAVPNGYDSFNAVGFWVAGKGGTVIRFDRAIAIAERLQAPITPAAPILDQPSEVTRSSAGNGSSNVSPDCDDVFRRIEEAVVAGDQSAALDITGFDVPKMCATYAEAEAAAVHNLGPRGARGLGAYLARSCAYIGPSAGIRDTDLCRELLAQHPELR